MDQSQSLSQVIESGNEYADPYQVYRRLLDVVTNETYSPEVLPYETEVTDLIVDQLQHMSESLEGTRSAMNRFCTEQHQMELERYSFVLRKYYRTRLQKIEKSAIELVKRLNAPDGKAVIGKLLSPAELKYLDRYVTSIDAHLVTTVSQHLPVMVSEFKLTDIVSNEKQEFDCTYVFVKAINRTFVTVDDPVIGQEVVVMEKGSQHFLPYSAIRNHLQQGSKDLILL